MNTKKRILIVDDEPSNISILAEILADNYGIAAALNGQDALNLALKEPQPDLILLDVVMPEMDGYEVCRRLKNDVRAKAIPIIFATGMDQPENEAQGLAIGAVDYITKPFDPAVILAKIKKYLSL